MEFEHHSACAKPSEALNYNNELLCTVVYETKICYITWYDEICGIAREGEMYLITWEDEMCGIAREYEIQRVTTWQQCIDNVTGYLNEIMNACWVVIPSNIQSIDQDYIICVKRLCTSTIGCIGRYRDDPTPCTIAYSIL